MVEMFKLKIFIKYLFKKPLYDLIDLFSNFKDSVRCVNQPTTWFWTCAYLTLYFSFYKRNLMTISSIFLLIAYIWTLWKSGDWMYDFRKNKGYEIKR